LLTSQFALDTEYAVSAHPAISFQVTYKKFTNFQKRSEQSTQALSQGGFQILINGELQTTPYHLTLEEPVTYSFNVTSSSQSSVSTIEWIYSQDYVSGDIGYVVLENLVLVGVQNGVPVVCTKGFFS
jgi:hypothetical protein